MAVDKTRRWQRYWDRHAKKYDKEMGFWDRRLFRDNRQWVCQQASGEVLEVAIGTGLNLPYYPDDVRLTGVEYSPAMLQLARRRAEELERKVDLREGDAHALDFPDGSFDTGPGAAAGVGAARLVRRACGRRSARRGCAMSEKARCPAT